MSQVRFGYFSAWRSNLTLLIALQFDMTAWVKVICYIVLSLSEIDLQNREELARKSELSLTSLMKGQSQLKWILIYRLKGLFSLTNFNKALVDLYLDIPYVEVRTIFRFVFILCLSQLFRRPNADMLAVISWENNPCSSTRLHADLTSPSASWMKAGYPSSFTIG